MIPVRSLLLLLQSLLISQEDHTSLQTDDIPKERDETTKGLSTSRISSSCSRRFMPLKGQRPNNSSNVSDNRKYINNNDNIKISNNNNRIPRVSFSRQGHNTSSRLDLRVRLGWWLLWALVVQFLRMDHSILMVGILLEETRLEQHRRQKEERQEKFNIHHLDLNGIVLPLSSPVC